MGRARLLSVALGAILVLSGCVQIDVASEFDRDGTAQHAITSTVDQTTLDDEMIDAEFQWNDLAETIGQNPDVEFEEIENGDRGGIRLSTFVEDNHDPGAALNSLFSALEPEATPIEPFTGEFTESGSALDGTSYQFELTVDADTLMSQPPGQLDDDVQADIDANMMRQVIDLTYSTSMPGEVTDHNGALSSGGEIEWDLPLEGTTTLYAESETRGGTSLVLLAAGALGGLALLLLIVGSVFLVRNRSAGDQAVPRSGAADL